MPKPRSTDNSIKKIARRRDSDGLRVRMSTSLDLEDAEFVRQVAGTSDSEKLAKIVRAARMNGLSVGEQTSVNVVVELVEWLSSNNTKSARELHKLLAEFIEQR